MNIENIWAEYSAGLKVFLHSRVSNTDEVDDLLQEILVKTYTCIDSIKSADSIKPWLYQIANNTIIDFYRRQAKSNDLVADDLWYAEADLSTREALVKCVTPFISALPTETAELLTAIDIEGRSQKDYAEATGLSYSTLKSRVQKARAELRSVFESCCRLSFDKQGNLADFESKSENCNNC